jgi:hypothetical protein
MLSLSADECSAARPRAGLQRHCRPALRTVCALVLSAVVGLLPARSAFGANTEPTLALMRASAVRSSSGRMTVVLEGSFSFADALQLGLAIDVQITQGAATAHCSLGGDVSVSANGGPPQPATPPCVLGVTDRTITLVLPAEFGPGEATAQLVLNHEGRDIASNRLGFTL